MLKYKKVPSLFFDGQYGLKCNIWDDPNFLSEYPDATPEELNAYFGYTSEEPQLEEPNQTPIAPQPAILVRGAEKEKGERKRSRRDVGISQTGTCKSNR